MGEGWQLRLIIEAPARKGNTYKNKIKMLIQIMLTTVHIRIFSIATKQLLEYVCHNYLIH